MSLRRAVVVVTILLGVTGVISYLRPQVQPVAPPTALERPASPPAAPAPDEEPLSLDVANPTELIVPSASRVVLTVRVPEAGDVEIDDLGLIVSAAPNAPALFDLLVDQPGEHGVFFRPAGGSRRVAGSLVVR